MKRFITRLWQDEQGQDMVEYAVLASFLSIFAIAAIRTIGPLVTTLYTNVQTALVPWPGGHDRRQATPGSGRAARNGPSRPTSPRFTTRPADEVRVTMGGPRTITGDWGTVLLLLLLLCCSLTDLRSRRIPNLLTVPSAAAGVVFGGLAAGSAGLWQSTLGLLLAGAVFLVPYGAGGMGAGDVKLMAAVGALVGFPHVVQVLLYTGLCGGLLALSVVVRRGQLGQAMRNLGWGLLLVALRVGPRGPGSAAGLQPAGHVPYATAIAAGTVAYLCLGRAV
ncbi:MAG: prepilin peptidase [Candidatus Latescibacterota bacterium]